MRSDYRWVLGLMVILLGSAFTSVWVAQAASTPTSLVVINYDLQGRKGPLPVAQYNQLNTLLMYLNPDVLVLHNVLKEAGSDKGKSLAKAALARDMYYAYLPLDDRLGSALISRYPIRDATSIYDQKTLATMGMQLAVKVGNRSYNVFVVRPPSSAVNKTTESAVLQQTKALMGTEYLVCASFSHGTGADRTVAAWKKAGMIDPLAKAKAAAFTYPYEKTRERLDFLLLSPKLQTDLLSSQVIKDERLAELSEHLPVQVILKQ